MFLFSSNKKEAEISMIIDIQSGLVRGALVINKENEQSRIVYVITREVIKKPHTDSSFLVKKMLKALTEVVEMLSNEYNAKAENWGFGKKSIKNIHYVLSSPWVLSQSKTISLKFEKSIEVNDKFIQNIIEEERKKIEEKFKNINFAKNSISANLDLIFIEQKVFEIKLNGYKVNSYDNKKVDNLDISFAATLSSKTLLKKIDAVIYKYTKIRKIQYHSALLLNFMSMRILVPEKNNFVSIHIHNGLTDIVVVKAGLSVNLSSFPFGTTTLLRKLALELRQDEAVVESTLSMYIDNKLEITQQENFKKVLNSVLQKWYIEYMKAVEHEDDSAFLPKTVYISAHAYVNVFIDIIKLNNELANMITFETNSTNMHVVFEKNSEYSQLMGMYALALRSMI